MKKTAIMLILLGAVCTAQSATLAWGVNMDSLLYVKDKTSIVMANSYAGDTTGWMYCLAWLGTSSTIDIGNISDSVIVDHFDYAVYPDGANAYPDVYSSTFTTTGSATALDGSTVTISAGDYFGIVFYNGSGYSFVCETDGTSVGNALASTVQLPSIAATANTVGHEIGGAAIVVPEPSVALMGLLGLGMLLKRRRA